MTIAQQLALAVCLALCGSPTRASAQQEHERQAADTPHSQAPTGNCNAQASDLMKRMDEHMIVMQRLHDRMARPRRAPFRQDLMSEHMKAMRDAMTILNAMRDATDEKATESGPDASGPRIPCDIATRQRMLEKRLDLMQSIMQMMVDQLPGAAKQQ